MEWKDLQPNLVLAADVVYDPSLVLPLAKTIRVLLSGPGKPRAFLSATIRHEQTWKDFLGCCRFISCFFLNQNFDYK
ncbi:hypothetical protein CROQUDRAFT_215561 [Cronartium quercuum f. sp. fusiforme G11]|uniref:Uncharacterized protein n=1 Tax=Cronartium quercuum f. sp. fusiforme G11 TaxID=708437 RepID=A0A9P6T9Q6_9BASI|nr:hypothetical protein CROQUDRAFT_215561 [Cronartium quercuum f. sp. fusiforme G11]